MIRVTLPYPISANRYWRPVRIGAHVTMVPTKEAKQYRKDVATICSAFGVHKPILGRVDVHLQLFPHRPLDWQKRMRKDADLWDDTVQCLDLPNAEKVLLDGLNGITFEDDKRIFRYLAERMEPDAHGARVVVTVKAWTKGVEAQVELPLPTVARAFEPQPLPF